MSVSSFFIELTTPHRKAPPERNLVRFFPGLILAKKEWERYVAKNENLTLGPQLL